MYKGGLASQGVFEGKPQAGREPQRFAASDKGVTACRFVPTNKTLPPFETTSLINSNAIIYWHYCYSPVTVLRNFNVFLLQKFFVMVF